MTEALEIAKRYFDLSNKSDFDGIAKLFTETTTYSSQTTGMYLGRDDILAMQKAFHGKFASLQWKVNSVEEVKPGIVLFDYDFRGELPNGEKVESSGLEYVIVYQGTIQHVEIRNKVLWDSKWVPEAKQYIEQVDPRSIASFIYLPPPEPRPARPNSSDS